MYMSYSHAEPGVYTNQFPMEQGWGCAQLPVTGGNVIGAEHYQPSGGYMFNAESENLEAAWKAYRAVFADVDMLAEYYEQEVEAATKNLTTAMEPAVIILLAVVVGGVVGAIVMPMMQIYSMAG